MVRVFAFLALMLVAMPVQAADAPQPADVAVQDLPDRHAVRFTLTTDGGYVGFTVPAYWTVTAMQSRMPVTVTAFQIAAAKSAPDTTTLSVSLIPADTDKGKAALTHDAEKNRTADETHYKNWTLHTREEDRGSTRYTIVTAQAPVADVICVVTYAWPHLPVPKYLQDDDLALDNTLPRLLDEVAGGIGPYAVHDGEVVRRPD